jgi:dihydroneopterin aldolase
MRGVRCAAPDGQVLLVDIVAATDLGPAAYSDDMADAVDIAELVATVREIVGGPPRALLESLVVHTARALLERFAAVDQVEVRMERPEPPGLNTAAEIVELTLARPN